MIALSSAMAGHPAGQRRPATASIQKKKTRGAASSTVKRPWNDDGVARPSTALSTSIHLHLSLLTTLKAKAERKDCIVHSQSSLKNCSRTRISLTYPLVLSLQTSNDLFRRDTLRLIRALLRLPAHISPSLHVSNTLLSHILYRVCSFSSQNLPKSRHSSCPPPHQESSS
jgi:hypothetical protein